MSYPQLSARIAEAKTALLALLNDRDREIETFGVASEETSRRISELGAALTAVVAQTQTAMVDKQDAAPRTAAACASPRLLDAETAAALARLEEIARKVDDAADGAGETSARKARSSADDQLPPAPETTRPAPYIGWPYRLWVVKGKRHLLRSAA